MTRTALSGTKDPFNHNTKQYLYDRLHGQTDGYVYAGPPIIDPPGKAPLDGRE